MLICPLGGDIVACCGWVRGLIDGNSPARLRSYDLLDLPRIERIETGSDFVREGTLEPNPFKGLGTL